MCVCMYVCKYIYVEVLECRERKDEGSVSKRRRVVGCRGRL